MFKPLPLFYNNYSINESGEVRSDKTNRILKTYQHKNTGYKTICLSKNNIKKSFTIHRLVALTFIENPKNYNEIDHIDRNKLNNHIDNLRWVDRCLNNQNRSVFKNTFSKEKHIHIRKYKDTFAYKLVIIKNHKILLEKSFHSKKYSIDDVKKIRDDFILSHTHSVAE